MRNNIIVSGLDEDVPQANKMQQIQTFFKDKLRMEFHSEKIMAAWRLGVKAGAPPRNITVKCAPALRDRIPNYTKHLRGLRNENNELYSVKQQAPEEYMSECKELIHKTLNI